MNSYRPRLSKTANFRLSSNIDLWTDEIYRHLSQTHPYLVNYLQGDIDWGEDPVNEESGSATGTVTALIGERPMRIPIVVRDFSLKPIDVYYTQEGKLDTLSEDVVVKNISPKTVDVGMKTDPYAQGASSIVDKVSNYQEFASDMNRIMDLVAEDWPKLAASCDRLRTLAVESDRGADSVSMAYQGGSYKLSAYRRGHLVDQFFLEPSTAFESPGSQLAEAARAAKLDGEVVMVTRSTDKVASRSNDQMVVDLDTLSALSVRLVSGESATGSLRKVASFSGAERKVFLSGDGYLDNLSRFGNLLEEAEGEVRETAATAIEKVARDSRGFLSVNDTLFGPLHVTSVFTNHHGERVISAETDEGRADLVMSKQATICVPVGNGRYLVPADSQFMAMPRLDPSHARPEDLLREKTAAEDLSSFRMQFSSGGYSLGVDEMKHDSLSRGETIACLTSLGLTAGSAQDCVKTARASEGTSLTFYGIEYPLALHKGDNLTGVQRQKVARVLDQVVDLRPAINKFASEVDNADMQDDLNSVNLMNQFNAGRFSDAVDELEAAKGSVAGVLHGIRVGDVDSVSEDTAKDAMMALDQIIKGLYDLSASQE
jgi:hypothetical protein